MPKTNHIVLSEGDLEFTVNYITRLALKPGRYKTANIVFPSEGMMDIFMENLFQSFIVNRVPRENNLDLTLNIPSDEGETNDQGFSNR